MKKTELTVFVGLLTPFLLGAFVRLYGLEKYYFWADEAVVLLLSKDLSFNILSHLRQEPHPPLYYFFLKAVLFVFGADHPLALRSISILSGLLTIIAGYFLGEKLTSKRSVGVFVSFLIATSPLCIEQSQLVRAYSLLLFWLFILFYYLTREPFKKSSFWLSCLFLVLATVTHFGSVVLFPALSIVGLMKAGQLQENKRVYQTCWIALLVVCGCFVLIAKSVAPSNLVTGHIQGLYSGAGSSLNTALRETLKIWGGFYGNQLRGIPLFALFSIFLGLIYLWRDKKFDLLLLFVGTYLTAFIFSLVGVYPFVSGRHSIVLLVPTLIPTLWLLNKTATKKEALLVLAGALVFFQVRSPRRIFYPDEMRWSLGEGSPKMEDLFIVSRAFKSGRLEGQPVLMDWGKYVSVLLERKLEPKWAVFSVANQPFESCSWGAFSEKETVCNCLRSVSNKRPPKKEILLMTAGRRETENVLAAVREEKNCGHREVSIPFNGPFSILSVVL